jgi:hypothetical protein
MTIRVRTSLVLALALAGAPASAQTLQRMHVSDAAAPVPGAARVETIPGPAPLPGSKLAPGQLPGWPKLIGGNPTFAPQRGLVFADLDRDGDKDILCSSTDSKVYAWDLSGALLPGFPVFLAGYAQSVPSVGDLDGDGDLEIVQLTRGITSGGRFYVLDHTGKTLPGFPKGINNSNLEDAPTLVDLDDDGELEIVLSERAWPIGYLHVYERDGSPWGGNWPVALDHVPTCATAVGDVDADGQPELVTMSYSSIYVLEVDGTPLPGWPQGIANANFSYQSPNLADLDGDGDLEIVVGAHQTAAGVYVYQHDGSLYPGWPKLVGTWTYCPPTVCDLEGDGQLDILAGREGFGPGNPSQVFWAWNADGSVKPGFPYVSTLGGGAAGPITTADIDGDGKLEIFSDHNIAQNNQGFLFGVDWQGNDLSGFPLRVDGFTYFNGAMIDDIDGDGDYELGVVSQLTPQVWVNLFDIGGRFEPARVAWGTYHGRDRRGGEQAGAEKLNGVGVSSVGGQLELTVRGEPGDLATLWAASSLSPRDTPFGWVYVTLPARRTLFSGAVLPASGQVETTLKLPATPALFGAVIYLQGSLVRFGGGGEVTNLLAFEVQ